MPPAVDSSETTFPPTPPGHLSAKGKDTVNTPYRISYERTRAPDLPFPHPKFHIRPATGEIYEVVSPILEEYDPISAYVDSVGPVMESVERLEGKSKTSDVSEGVDDLPREEKEGAESAEDGESVECREDREDSGWMGYVNHPESKERTSLAREAKRARDTSGESDTPEIDANRSKRVKDLH